MDGYAADMRLDGSERGAVSVSTLLLLAVAGVCAYALAGALATDPDRYGRVAIPSNSWVELPGAETGIGVVAGPGSRSVAGVSEGLRVDVVDPRTGEALRIDPRGQSSDAPLNQKRRQIAAVDPPSGGYYQVIVTAGEGASAGSRAQLSFGQSPIGAVGDRFAAVLEIVAGPIGLAVALVLAVFAFRPRFQRVFTRRADGFG